MLRREGEKDAAVSKDITPEYLDTVEDDMLKEWRGFLEAEIESRLERPGSPKKKSRRN